MKQVLSFLSLFLLIKVQVAGFSAAQLTCEQLTNPLGIDVRQPLFSWMIESSENGIRQSAYELIVSDNKADIDANRGNIWNTGKTVSDETVFITFEGASLQPFTRYWWKVRVYDQNGRPSQWSQPAWFETAMLDVSDWKAQWIGDGSRQFESDEDFYRNDPMPLFRKTFTVKKQVTSARLYICGLGYFEAYINGARVGDHVLDPGWTAHRKHALYVVHDITSQLQRGTNVAGVMLGNGWYNPLPLRLFGTSNLREYQQTGRPVVKAQMLVKYSDGTSELVSTDNSWKTAPGPVIRNNVYLGEHYDARAEISNWNKTSLNDSNWKNAVAAEGPSGELTVQMQPAVKVGEVVKPVRIYEQQPGVYIVDMGINFAGVARIRVKGPAGTTINIRYGEDIHPDGSLNWLTSTAGQIKSMWNLRGGPGAPADGYQEDRYTLKGTGTEVYAPRFTFHGFRYLEITGWPGKPSLSDFEGLRMYAALIPNGEFTCSNDMFNQLHEITLRTFLSNVFSVQSDCPAREKMGYGGDIVATAESFLYNYDMGNFYRKTVRDFINDQNTEGSMPSIAPFTNVGNIENFTSLGWQLAFPYVLKQLYDFYGDKRILEASYPAFVKQMNCIQSKAVEGLFHWGTGDHETLELRTDAFSSSAFYYEHARLIAEFATILGKTEDAARYSRLSERIRNLLIQRFYVPGTGRFDNATQVAQILGLYYDLSPEPKLSFDFLLSEYARRNWHISTGIFGCKMGFDVLRRYNRNDVAYHLTNQRTYPGWGFMLARGATTVWESWYYPDNAPSQNHPMFGSTEEWFYRSLLGINAAQPGFREIIIKPQPAGDLKWAKGSYQSIRGKIVSDWQIEGNSFNLSVEIPANTTATIYVPTTGVESVKAPEQAIAEGYKDGYAMYRVPSGKYQFSATNRPNEFDGAKLKIFDSDYQGFYVNGTKIYDGNGTIFKPVGFNTLFKYWDKGGEKTVPGIGKTSANCVRMFWSIDDAVPVSDLEDAVRRAVDNQLVVMVGIWDATGKWNNLDQCVDYWLRDDVKKVVQKYEKYFMLNIANEAGDKTVPEEEFESKYIEVVKKLREAGFRVPLMIDPANWGRDERYILNCGNKILESDPLRNIIFGWHPWDIKQPRSRYTNAIRASLEKNLCMIVGEFSHLGANYEGPLDWRPLVEECNRYNIGWLPWAWSLAGDKHNIVENFDLDQITEWGKQVLFEMDQVAVKASIFR